MWPWIAEGGDCKIIPTTPPPPRGKGGIPDFKWQEWSNDSFWGLKFWILRFFGVASICLWDDLGREFLGIQNNVEIHVVPWGSVGESQLCTLTSVFYFLFVCFLSCYITFLFWKILRLWDMAWDFLRANFGSRDFWVLLEALANFLGWFLIFAPFNHPHHLESIVPPTPPPRKKTLVKMTSIETQFFCS